MSGLKLSLAILRNERSSPIIDGQVRVQGIDLDITVGKSGGEIFWRQLHFQEFDIAEMSFSDMLMLVSRGHMDWVMLPVFTTRRFFHTNILVRADSDIQGPADLRGRKVGLQEYVQTANVFARGVLHDEFGVHPDEMHWYQERSEEMGHCHHFGMKPPVKRFDFVPADRSVGEMILSGELDAVMTYPHKPNLMDRSSARLRGNPRIRPLFPKPREEQLRYYRKTGFFPINHAPVIRRSLVEAHPWIALNLYQVFLEAKERAMAPLREIADAQSMLGWIDDDTRRVLDRDPYPYGLAANRGVLETCARYSLEQGLSARSVALDEVFAEQALSF
ncbi:PhnD/SsuA/transferrin family substrate-binding protein [Chelativorans alearense]|uniref:PhnD/SsuA/transferrin family substrate-binding protein n=1 Tax=Chelativorans alearense TaxID=2681495 RepID=UPI0013CFAC7A|nr:PhnD/SsuA/transferrin family substrate-binding protein [Chelativorans alearense]